jgi:hypothetical protein
MDLLEQIITAEEEDAVTGATCTVPECARQRGLPDTDGPKKDDVLTAVEKLEARING